MESQICTQVTDCTLLQGIKRRPADTDKAEKQPKKLRHADSKPGSSKQVRVFLPFQHTIA